MSLGGAKKRVFGLDLIRAAAIVMVLIGHSSDHFDPPHWFRWFWGAQGTLGVEIFFVLSGYLIGSILIRMARQGRLHTATMIWTFWSRRWARTLPLYFVFVLVYLRFDYLGVGDLFKTYPFLFFMQNFAWSPIPFFQHSWSLPIEEWFYFLFPLVFLWFAHDARSYRKPLMATCAVFILVPLLIRMVVARHIHDYAGFNDQIRMVVVCRLDAVFFGVLLALIKTEWPSLYGGLRWCGIPGLALLVAAMFYLAAGMPRLFDHYWAMVFFFPVLSVLGALSLPLLERVTTLGWSWLDRFVTHTSEVSYSLYLGHICMLSLVNAVIVRLGIAVHGAWETMLVYMVYGVAYYALATLTYRYVEQPFLRLRDAPLIAASVKA